MLSVEHQARLTLGIPWATSGYLAATSDLSPRKAGRGQGSRGRTVFGPHFATSEPQRVSYYHHAAPSTRYRRLAGTWYCELEPGYCFTTDGYNEADRG